MPALSIHEAHLLRARQSVELKATLRLLRKLHSPSALLLHAAQLVVIVVL